MDFFNLQNSNSQNKEDFDFNFICQDYGLNQNQNHNQANLKEKLNNTGINLSPIEPSSQNDGKCFWKESEQSQEYNYNFSNTGNNVSQPEKNDFYSNIKRNSSDLENELNDLKSLLKSIPNNTSHSYNFNIPQNNTKNTNRRNLKFDESLYEIKEEKEPELSFIEDRSTCNTENKILYSFTNTTNKKPKNFVSNEKTNAVANSNTNSSNAVRTNQVIEYQENSTSLQSNYLRNMNENKPISINNLVKSELPELPEIKIEATSTKTQNELYREFSDILIEKKQDIKKITNISKLFDILYVKIEDFKTKTPNIIEQYLFDFYVHLEKYNFLLNLDDAEIDTLIEENEKKMEKIKEKYKLN